MSNQLSKPHPSSPLAIFVHIPKAAGTTLAFVLRRQYTRRGFLNLYDKWQDAINFYANLPVENRAHYKVARGHIGYGIHKQLNTPNYSYFTILREPVSRVVSHYYFHKNHPFEEVPPLSQLIAEKNIDLKTYVTDLQLKDLDNYQTRLIIGQVEGMEPEFGQCPPEFLELAKQRLEKDFVAVGITERFDESLLVLQKIFGWSIPLYVSQNISRGRPKDKVLAPDVQEAIAQINQLDFELYQHANQVLDRLIAQNFKFFKIRLAVFRFLNRLYNYAYQLSRKLSPSTQKQLDIRFFAEK